MPINSQEPGMAMTRGHNSNMLKVNVLTCVGHNFDPRWVQPWPAGVPSLGVARMMTAVHKSSAKILVVFKFSNLLN